MNFLENLLRGCSEDSFDDGIRIDTELEPLFPPGGPIKPAVYEGGELVAAHDGGQRRFRRFTSAAAPRSGRSGTRRGRSEKDSGFSCASWLVRFC